MFVWRRLDTKFSLKAAKAINLFAAHKLYNQPLESHRFNRPKVKQKIKLKVKIKVRVKSYKCLTRPSCRPLSQSYVQGILPRQGA